MSAITTPISARRWPLSYGVAHWHGPREALALCGLRPEDVDTVFITHAHFDHFGNVEAFPKAHFYIAEQEIEKSIWALALPERLKFLATAIDPGDLAKGAAARAPGPADAGEEDMADVLPGIDLHIAPDTHSFASMWVELRNDRQQPSDDVWVLAGDLVYAYENLGGAGAGRGERRALSSHRLCHRQPDQSAARHRSDAEGRGP